MRIESIIEVGRSLQKRFKENNTSEKEILDTYRLELEPHIYHYLIEMNSEKLNAHWLNYIPPRYSKHAYVIVERRCHPNFEFILKSIAWANPTMAVYIVCSTENLQFIKSILGTKESYYTLLVLFHGNVSREDAKNEYNTLLTSARFYDMFITCDYILTIQMDVIIRRKIPDSIFCGDYWGSPWAWKQSAAGGGGATIRKINILRSICNGYCGSAGYEIEDPSDLRFCCAALRGSTVNVRGGNPDTSVGGLAQQLTSVLDGSSAEDAWISDHVVSFPDISFRANHIMESIPVENPILIHQFWTFFDTFSKASADYWKHILTIEI